MHPRWNIHYIVSGYCDFKIVKYTKTHLIPIIHNHTPTLEQMLESCKVLLSNEGDESSVR